MIVSQPARVSIGLVLFLFFLGAVGAQAGAEIRLGVKVDDVIDGDTVVVEGGDRIRFLGIDTPERNEEYAERAKSRTIELIDAPVDLILCEEKDDYGRYLAILLKGGMNVNLTLLGEGLARPMLIPPCGKMVADEVLRTWEAALLSRRGIFSGDSFVPVNHEKALEKLGSPAVIRGRVMNLHKGRTAWHLNFGEDWRTDFTAVLFREGRVRFRDLGFRPEDLVGVEVLVVGVVREYYGPQIVVRGPEQVIPLN